MLSRYGRPLWRLHAAVQQSHAPASGAPAHLLCRRSLLRLRLLRLLPLLPYRSLSCLLRRSLLRDLLLRLRESRSC
jgi:hypothetical protein